MSEQITPNPKYLIQLQGKPYLMYGGLLGMAHAKGLISIDVQLIQIPSADNENTAIVKANALFPDGHYEEYGDASPRNTKLVGALIRMAATRAKARCLRDAVNWGDCTAEELPDNETDEQQPRNTGQQRQPKSEAPRGSSIQAEEGFDHSQPPGEGPACTVCGHPVTKGRAAYCSQNRRPIVHPQCQGG